MEICRKWFLSLAFAAAPFGMMAEVGDTVSVREEYSWLTTKEVVVDNVQYGLYSTSAYAYTLSDDFIGHAVVLADSVEAEFGVRRSVSVVTSINEYNGGEWTDSHYDTIYVKKNLPVTDVHVGFLRGRNIESISLPIGFTQANMRFSEGFFEEAYSLREIHVKAGNAQFSSPDGLLCNLQGDSLLYVPYAYGDKRTVIMPKSVRVVPIGVFANREAEYDIVFQDSISYAYLSDKHLSARLVNQVPPEIPNPPYVLYVPKGAGSAYIEKFQSSYDNGYLMVVEDGSNVERIQRNKFWMTTVYDVDNDGVMELVGYRSKSNYLYGGDEGHFIALKGRDELRRDSVLLNASTRMDMGVDDFDGSLQYYTYRREGIGSDAPVYRDVLTVYTPTEESPAAVSPEATLYADVDNDGRKDLVMAFKNQDLNVMTRQPDGSYKDNIQYVTANPEEVTASHGDTSTPWDVAVLSEVRDMLRGGMFVYETARPLECINRAVDANGDGILDLIDTQKGGILYSYDDNKYYKQTSTEIVYPYDINGDGLTDYVIYNGEALYFQPATPSGMGEKVELYKNKKIDQVLFRDFDHDGDIDILMFFCTSSYQGDSYFVFLRNNGDGTFRRKEQNYPGTQYELLECRDYDADGCYELMVKEGYTRKLLKVNSDFTMTVQEVLHDNDIILGDFCNDGFTEFYADNGRPGYYSAKSGDKYGKLASQTIRNTPPKKMAAPTALLQPESQRLKISWLRGEDAETSACDLTYELRIGSQPGADDVMRVESLGDGRRRTIREGRQGTSLQTLFNAATLKPGKYYISVQAIDQGGLGGAFSDELVYEHQVQAPKIYVSNSQLSTVDTLTAYVKSVLPGADYHWSAGDGEVLEQREDGSVQFVFHEPDDHEIGLSMVVDGVSYKSSPVTVYADAVKEVSSADGHPFFDFNQDGWIESYYLNRSYGGTFYKGNENGEQEKLLLSTFADINGTIRSVIDYNHDGYPDFLVSDCSKGNVFLNYGEQDYDFDYKTIDMTLPDYYGESKLGQLTLDLNNDGWPDANDECMMSTRDGLVWTERPYNWDDGTFAGFYDINRDGFPDLVYYRESPQYGEEGERVSTGLKFYVRLKDNTEELNYGEEQVLFSIPDSVGTYDMHYHIADFNNDGYYDLAFNSCKDDDGYQKTGYSLNFIKGKPEAGSSDVVLTIENVDRLCTPVDIDNDGYLEFPKIGRNRRPSGDGFTYDYDDAMLKMKPNFTYEWVHGSGIEGSDVIPMSSKGDYWINEGLDCHRFKTNIPNLPPSAPASVAVKQTQDGMLISWADAQDDRTPAMQMRYNISVKRKGKSGANSFVISPMNGLKDEAAIVPGYQYKKSTQMLVPSTVLIAGETYEIQVQSIDLWGAHSPMTQAVEFTMGGDGYIVADERVAVDTNTQVALRAAQADSYGIDLGSDGEVVENLGNGQFVVKWHTPGVKTFSITAGAAKFVSSMTVVNRADVSFTMPALVLAGAPLTIEVSDEMACLTGSVGFMCDNADVTYTPGSKTAVVYFPSVGTYSITSYYNDRVCGNKQTQTVVVSGQMPEARINRVNVDVNNHYVVSWDEWPSYINEVVVLKESIYGYLMAVDTVPATDGAWVDASSNALVASTRYCVKLLAENGQKSTVGQPHKPMHIMLTNSPMGGYNLVWNAYEGLTVGTYKVWRGIDDGDMELIEQCGWQQQSYTDLSMPAYSERLSYCVSFTPLSDYFQSRSQSGAKATDDEVRSNIISTEHSTSVLHAQQISIVAVADELKLTEEQPSIRLYGIVLPAYTTITRVAWSIVDGDDLASVSSSGLLTAFGESGSVTVSATTLDGTNLTAELTIPIEMAEGMKGDVNRDKVVDVADVVQTVNHILGRTPSVFAKRNADVNGDGEINVGDLVGMVGIIADGYSETTAARFDVSAMTEQLMGFLTTDAAVVALRNPQYFTAFQMLITLPEGVGKEKAELRLPASAGHVVATNWLSDRQVMVVAYSMGRHPFATDGHALLQVVADDALHGDWLFDNIVFACADGTTCKFNPLSLNQTSGISETVVQSGTDERIFDLSGRPVVGGSPRRGLYINGSKKKFVR